MQGTQLGCKLLFFHTGGTCRDGGGGRGGGQRISLFDTSRARFPRARDVLGHLGLFFENTYNLTYGAGGSPSHFTGVRPQDVQVITETGGSRPAGPSVAISEALPSATQAQKILMSLVLAS